MNKARRVLVVSDDGEEVPGRATLARAVADAGHQVVSVSSSGRADLVVSGVNRQTSSGVGLGASRLCLPALPALSVSIEGEKPRHLDTAGAVGALALSWLVDATPGTVMHVTVPDLPLMDLAGFRWSGPGADAPAELVNAGFVSLRTVPGARAVHPAGPSGVDLGTC